MKRFLMAIIVASLQGGNLGYTQAPRDIYSSAVPPSRETLDRLNLVLQWHQFLPTDGYRDSIHSMLIGPKQHFVQLRSGKVIALDAPSGRVLWQTQVGDPYHNLVGFGANETLIFVAKAAQLYAVDKKTGLIVWVYDLPLAAAAAPVADDTSLYVPIGSTHMLALDLPKPGAVPTAAAVAAAKPAEPGASGPRSAYDIYYNGRSFSSLGSGGQGLQSISAVSSRNRNVASVGPISSARDAAGSAADRARPEILWQFRTETRPETRLEQSSILTQHLIFQSGQNGLFFALKREAPLEIYRFQADASVAAPLGRYGDIAYVASQDFHLYALDIETGRIIWRFGVGGPILLKPRVSDEDVYVATERNGLYRLERKSGFQVWRNSDADRFLAMNPKYVYVTDHSGRLLILDRATGTQQALWDGARSYGVPISNETNDRVFLCSASGQIVCLHDRDYPGPFSVKTVQERVSPPPAGNKPAAK
jgi:outer membrane protein assembly factor BamB